MEERSAMSSVGACRSAACREISSVMTKAAIASLARLEEVGNSVRVERHVGESSERPAPISFCGGLGLEAKSRELLLILSPWSELPLPLKSKRLENNARI